MKDFAIIFGLMLTLVFTLHPSCTNKHSDSQKNKSSNIDEPQIKLEIKEIDGLLFSEMEQGDYPNFYSRLKNFLDTNYNIVTSPLRHGEQRFYFDGPYLIISGLLKNQYMEDISFLLYDSSNDCFFVALDENKPVVKHWIEKENIEMPTPYRAFIERWN